MALGFTFAIKYTTNPDNLRLRMKEIIGPIVVEAMVAMLISVTNPAPEGIPVISGMAKGAFMPLARTLNRLAIKYGVAFTYPEFDGSPPKYYEDKTPDAGALLSYWRLDKLRWPTVRFTFTTEIPYWWENETTDKNWKNPQRDTPWNLTAQMQNVFYSKLKELCDLHREIKFIDPTEEILVEANSFKRRPLSVIRNPQLFDETEPLPF